MLLLPFGRGGPTSAANQSIITLFTEAVSVLPNVRSNEIRAEAIRRRESLRTAERFRWTPGRLWVYCDLAEGTTIYRLQICGTVAFSLVGSSFTGRF